jgi:adenylate cyclase class IV
MSLEVEQKFHIRRHAVRDLESQLERWGFHPVGTVTFVDWYFDVEDHVSLSRNDTWLRYRETSGIGQWQLKIGRGHGSGTTTTTVYEEIEGDPACVYAVSCLKEGGYNTATTHGHSQESSLTFEEFDIPKFPESVGDDASSYGLRPFCRLETRRSSWKVDRADNPYFGLSVDVDTTNTGHTVGEVEMMCTNEAEVEAGKARVQDLIVQLCGRNANANDDDVAAMGKLEHFLLHNRPWHYEICVQSGVLPKVPRADP